jgi:hypothetical protein
LQPCQIIETLIHIIKHEINKPLMLTSWKFNNIGLMVLNLHNLW